MCWTQERFLPYHAWIRPSWLRSHQRHQRPATISSHLGCPRFTVRGFCLLRSKPMGKAKKKTSWANLVRPKVRFQCPGRNASSQRILRGVTGVTDFYRYGRRREVSCSKQGGGKETAPMMAAFGLRCAAQTAPMMA